MAGNRYTWKWESDESDFDLFLSPERKELQGRLRPEAGSKQAEPVEPKGKTSIALPQREQN